MPVNLTRRGFMVGCSAAIASMAGARLTHVAFSEPSAPGALNKEMLVVVFLRGGWDALNVVPPIAGSDRGPYESARQYLKVPATGTGAALPLNGQFGLHPAMAPLYGLYQSQKLAVIHACGLNNDTRSHFDAMEYIELGTPGNKNTASGWLTRHLQTMPDLPSTILIPAVSSGGSQPTALLGSNEAVSMTSPGSFEFSGHWNYQAAQRVALRRIYDGDTWLFKAGAKTLDAVDIVESANPGTYTPSNGAVYPGGSFGDSLKAIAQMIKMDIGMRVATVDLGGWDTHDYQGDGSGGYFSTQLSTLAQGLAAFYLDLDGSGCSGFTRRLTVVVQSEFGRRLRENAGHGTDHGHGSVMLTLGGRVKGGKIYGTWPGLQTDQLYDRADLAVTTDYRRVLSEVLVGRLGNSSISTVFPGYTDFTPLGFIMEPYTPPPPTPPGLNNKVYVPSLSRMEADVCP